MQYRLSKFFRGGSLLLPTSVLDFSPILSKGFPEVLYLQNQKKITIQKKSKVSKNGNPLVKNYIR